VTESGDRLRDIRTAYEQGALGEDDLAPTWLEQFELWLSAAIESGSVEPNAMVLATADADGLPGARTVLLRGLDARGFWFMTNYDSRKGRELAANPRATLVFPWYAQHRQVVVDGEVERLSAEESDAYFAARPRGARISAHASPQSEPIESRDWLQARWDEVERAHAGRDDVPRPEGWGGFLVRPRAVEFWQGRRDRLHDRLRYRRVASDGGAGDAWVVERLAP
jgi:pyridoxamine 5'-phosphate oxidase